MRKCSFFFSNPHNKDAPQTPPKKMCAIFGDDRLGIGQRYTPSRAKMAHIPKRHEKAALHDATGTKKRGKTSVKTPFPSLSSDMYVLCHFISITRFSAVFVSGRRFGRSTVRTPSATLAQIRSLSTSSGKMKDCWNLE